MTLEIIRDFIKKYPNTWKCDSRLPNLRGAETLRNTYEAYREKNCENVPSLDDLQKYWHDVNGQIFQDVCREIKLNDDNLYSLDDDGCFYKVHMSEDNTISKLIFKAPLTILAVTEYGNRENIQYRIHYRWLGKEDYRDAPEFLQHIGNTLKLNGTARQHFGQFLYELIRELKEKNMIDYEPDPVGLDRDKNVHVDADTEGIDIKETLHILREYHDRSSNPHAFRSVMAMAVIAPLNIEIKRYARPGFIMPMPLLMGETKASKTSLTGIFVQTGLNQTQTEGMLADQTIATHYTFVDALSRSVLPAMLNDLDQAWFTKSTTILKNISEHVIAFSRGRPDLSIVSKEARRLPFLTSNEIIRPSDDAAAHRRYVVELFTEQHVKRKNEALYNAFMDKIKPGFLYHIIREIYGGHSIHEIVSELQNAKSSTEFVQIILNRINELCRKYGVDPFPPYTANDDESDLFTDDDFTAVIEYATAEFHKMQSTDEWGHIKNTDLTFDDIDMEPVGENTIIWLTGTGYRKIQRKLNLKHRTISELFSNYVKNDRYGITSRDKFRRFNGTPARGFAIWVRNDDDSKGLQTFK